MSFRPTVRRTTVRDRLVRDQLRVLTDMADLRRGAGVQAGSRPVHLSELHAHDRVMRALQVAGAADGYFGQSVHPDVAAAFVQRGRERRWLGGQVDGEGVRLESGSGGRLKREGVFEWARVPPRELFELIDRLTSFGSELRSRDEARREEVRGILVGAYASLRDAVECGRATPKDLEDAKRFIANFIDPSIIGLSGASKLGAESIVVDGVPVTGHGKADRQTVRVLRQIMRQRRAVFGSSRGLQLLKGYNSYISGGASGVIYVEDRLLEAFGMTSPGMRSGKQSEDVVGVGAGEGLLFHVLDGAGGVGHGAEMAAFVERGMRIRSGQYGMPLDVAADLVMAKIRSGRRVGLTTYAGVKLVERPGVGLVAQIATAGDSQVVLIRNGRPLVVSVPHSMGLVDSLYHPPDENLILTKMMSKVKIDTKAISRLRHRVSSEKWKQAIQLLYRYACPESRYYSGFYGGWKHVVLDIAEVSLRSGDILWIYTDGAGSLFSPFDLSARDFGNGRPLYEEGFDFAEEVMAAQRGSRRVDIGLPERPISVSGKDNFSKWIIKIK